MKRAAVQSLATVIKANTTRRTLSDLAAEGKSHVRVVSGAKVMKLIQGIVEDTIRREAMELADADRDRIVAETQGRFSQAMKLQNEQDEIIQMQKGLLDEQKSESRSAEERIESLTHELGDVRDEIARKEGRALGEHQDRIARLEKEKGDLSSRLRKLDAERGELVESLSRQRRRLLEVEAEKATVGDSVEESLAKVTSAEERVRRLEERLENERAQLDSSGMELERLREQLTEQRDRMADREARMVGSHQEEIVRLNEAQRELIVRMEGDRGALAGRQEQVLAEAQQKLQEMKALCGDLQGEAGEADSMRERVERDLARLRARQAAATSKIEALEKEVVRLTEELSHARASASSNQKELMSGREQAAARSASQLQQEVRQLNELVRTFTSRPTGPDEDVIDRLLATLGEQKSDMAEHFDSQMERTLTEVTRALKKATASPLDDVVEATDVLIDRVFDDDAEMTSNLSSLSVEEHKSTNGISSSLERLRQAMRGEDAQAEE